MRGKVLLAKYLLCEKPAHSWKSWVREDPRGSQLLQHPAMKQRPALVSTLPLTGCALG